MKSPSKSMHGKIAVCSRGLVQSRTAEAISEIQHASGWRPRFTHSDSIPDAQNRITADLLLYTDLEWILFLEEDIVPPWDLIDCATSDSPVQCVDYNLPGGNKSIRYDDTGNIVFCGMGCLFVTVEVFKMLPKPWFSTSAYTLDRQAGRQYLVPTTGEVDFGGQDVGFCYSLQQAQIPIAVINGITVEHLRVKRLGQPGSNVGCHEVVQL